MNKETRAKNKKRCQWTKEQEKKKQRIYMLMNKGIKIKVQVEKKTTIIKGGKKNLFINWKVTIIQ